MSEASESLLYRESSFGDEREEEWRSDGCCCPNPGTYPLAASYGVFANIMVVLIHISLCFFYIWAHFGEFSVTELVFTRLADGNESDRIISTDQPYSNLKQYWESGGKALAVLIFICSIMLPYTKVVINMLVWFWPIKPRIRRSYLMCQEQTDRWLLFFMPASIFSSLAFYIDIEISTERVQLESNASTAFLMLIAGYPIMQLNSHLLMYLHDLNERRIDENWQPRASPKRQGLLWWNLQALNLVALFLIIFYIDKPIVTSSLKDPLKITDKYNVSFWNFSNNPSLDNMELTVHDLLRILCYITYVVAPIGASAWVLFYGLIGLRRRMPYWLGTRALEIFSAWASLDVFWLATVVSALSTEDLSKQMMDGIGLCAKLEQQGITCFTVAGYLQSPAVWVTLIASVVQRLILCMVFASASPARSPFASM